MELNQNELAEELILQLPITHDGRNTWLMNYGTSEVAKILRENKSINYNQSHELTEPCYSFDEINKHIIDLLFKSVISEGGDGNALWLSRYTSLDELFITITEYNEKNQTDWDLERFDNYIWWGDESEDGETQESVTITNDKDYFNLSQNYVTLIINY